MNQAKDVVNKILDLPTIESIKKFIKQIHVQNEE